MTATVAELTVPQKVLLAAASLEQQGQTPFSAEALIVSAWTANPRTFGLKGYVDLYPDSNKILSCIMGEKGLARRGWLTKVGQKLYTLSKMGRDEVKRLTKTDDGEAPAVVEQEIEEEVKTPKVSRDQEKLVTRLFSATAVLRFREGLRQYITFRDACAFWGVSDISQTDAVREAAVRVPALLEGLEPLLAGGSLDLSSGRKMTKDDVKLFLTVHGFLKEQFARHLSAPKPR
jgi:hypothetical protein